MGFEVRLTDIRGEPPLQVGEFLLDKDNNILYVGKGDFDIDKDRKYLNDIFTMFKVELQLPPDVKFNAVINLNQRYNAIKHKFVVDLVAIVDVKTTYNVELEQRYNSISNKFDVVILEVIHGSIDKNIVLTQKYNNTINTFKFESEV